MPVHYTLPDFAFWCLNSLDSFIFGSFKGYFDEIFDQYSLETHTKLPKAINFTFTLSPYKNIHSLEELEGI